MSRADRNPRPSRRGGRQMVDIQEGENAPSGSLHYLGGPGA
jgi:hypothetical protein